MAREHFVPRGPLTAGLAVAGAVVVGAGLIVELVHTQSHAGGVERAVELLSLSYEHNLPTWYASCLLFAAATGLCAIAAHAYRTRDRARFHWWGLAAGFFFMSLDEATELHENLAGLYHGSGVLYFGWVVPAAAIVVVIGALYLPFVRRLGSPTRERFVVAGVVYLTGALVMELPLGWWTERAGAYNATYAMIDLVEEALELVGVSLFLVSVYAHRDAHRPQVST
jgi:hypothetical protein